MIKAVKLGFVNVFLIIEPSGVILVDTGLKGSKQKIEKSLSEEGKTFDDIKLIILTHSHQDHIGGLQELKEVINAPIMMSSIEYNLIQNNSDDALPTGPIGKKLFRFVSRMERPTEESFMDKPDILVDQHWHLAPFNIDAEVFLTPGHTRGSLSILTAEGDAIIGDSLMAMMPWQGPGRPILAYDLERTAQSVQQLADAGAKTFWLSHGGSFERARILGAIAKF